jgi:glucose-1-phosphate adenylyltransferase
LAGRRHDRFYQANIELTGVEPHLNLYDDHWPVRTYQPNLPPPKFVFNSQDRCGAAYDSLVCVGAIISGGQVTRTIVGPQTRVNSYAEVEDSILFSRVNIGRRAKIRRAIIDKGVQIPEGFRVGYDEEEDLARGFTVSDNGVVVIAKAESFEPMFAESI